MTSNADRLVVVVDDDKSILDSIADLLASAGYDTVTFQAAAELLAWGQLQRIGCLVSDICLPGMDGWQLVAQLRQHRKQLPVVLITAHDPVAGAGHDRHGGAAPVQVLRKPFEPRLLLHAIERAIDST